MASLNVPNQYLSLSPIIVTSPTARCGTTLIQRLLTASDNGFVFGEEVGNQVRVLASWFVGQMQVADRGGEANDEEVRQALAGVHAEWRPGLTPPSSVMMQAWVETFYQLPAHVAAYSASVGRPQWGFKYPGYNRDTLRAILSLLPQAKIIYVYRSLFDALKSAKARRFLNTPEETVEFCAQWSTNLNETSQLASDERILFLKYEDFVARRDEHLKLLEMFTGVTGMKAEVFDAKINTFRGDASQGMAPGGYIAPADLTEAERAAVSDQAGTVMQRLYGDAA